MPDEEPRLLLTENGPTLQWRGLSLYPPADPVEYARRKARVFSPLPRTLVFVPSLGLGHGLADLLRRLPDDCGILCIEAFQEIMGIALTQELPRDPRLLIVRTADPAAAAGALHEMGVGRFRRVVELPLCAGYRLAPEIYASLRRALESEISLHWQNRLTLIGMGSLQVRNIFSNMPRLATASDFACLSTPLPAVVCGAGPSLEQSIPLMRELRDRYVLVAADTALPTLTACGCAPDIVVALEAQAANLQDFLPGVGPEVRLACDISSHPVAPRLFPEERLFFFSSRFAPLSVFERMAARGLLPARFPALGSVGVAAVHAALRLTSGPVLLAGLDFSFPGSRTHARGSPSQQAMLRTAGRTRPVGLDAYRALCARSLLKVKDKNGRDVITDRVLSSYRDTLESEAGREAGRVGDIGPEGLPLGVPHLSPSEVRAILGAAPAGAVRLRRAARPRAAAGQVRGFLRSERELLGRSGAATLGVLPAAEMRALLRAVDHAWVHFPDEPDLDAPDPGFLARVRVAAVYYERRIERIESVL